MRSLADWSHSRCCAIEDAADSAPAEPKRRKRRAKNIPVVLPPHHIDLPHPNPPAIHADVNGIRLTQNPPIKPTLENYRELAESWTDTEISHYLLCTKAKANNRIPQAILDEARALENELTTRLQVLSIAGGISYDTLKYGVLSYYTWLSNFISLF